MIATRKLHDAVCLALFPLGCLLVGIGAQAAENKTTANGTSAAVSSGEIAHVLAQKDWTLSGYYPFQIYQTKNPSGSKTAYTLFGFGLTAELHLAARYFMQLQFENNLDATSSASIFKGGGLAAGFQIFGKPQIAQDSSRLVVQQTPGHRGFVYCGMGMRTFDFRPLIGLGTTLNAAEEIALRSSGVETEGSFWAPSCMLKADLVDLSGRRMGAFLQSFQSLKNKLTKTQVSAVSFGIHYEFIHF